MISLNDLMKYSFWKLVLVVATIVGAFGGFPEPPKTFQKLTSYPLVQWGLVFVLAYQGGAGEDPKLAAMVTAGAFILYKGVTMLEKKHEEY